MFIQWKRVSLFLNKNKEEIKLKIVASSNRYWKFNEEKKEIDKIKLIIMSDYKQTLSSVWITDWKNVNREPDKVY